MPCSGGEGSSRACAALPAGMAFGGFVAMFSAQDAPGVTGKLKADAGSRAAEFGFIPPSPRVPIGGWLSDKIGAYSVL